MFLRDHNKVAIIAGEKEITYKELLEKITFFADQLKVRKGSHVVIYSENRLEWIYAFYAIWKNNAVPVPVDFMSGTEDLAYILQDCKPEIVCCSKERLPALKKAMEGISHTPDIIVLDEITMQQKALATTFLFEPDMQNTAVIIYTSGTTGSPKGVMLTFENLISNIHSVSRDVRIFTSDDRVMVMLPMHHIFPLQGTLIIPLFMGSAIVICPSLNSEDVRNTLQNNKVTIVIGVPKFYKVLKRGIKEKIDASKIAGFLFRIAELTNSLKFSRVIFKKIHKAFGGSIKYLVCGGAALDAEISTFFMTLGFEILEGYGMTEAAPMITFTRPGDFKKGSAGQPMPSTEVEIHDEEIVARGPNIMKGYLNRPEETGDILKNGWLHTGDLGYLDEQGHIFITGRKKEIIVLSNGKNINPEESERKLEAVSNYVKEAGVFVKNDILQVIIFPDLAKMRYDGIDNVEEYFRWNIIDKYNQEVSPYKKIMKFILVDEELPKTRLEKLQRYKFAEIAEKGKREKQIEIKQPEFPEYLTIKDFLENETETTIYPGDHIEMDIALDSLGKIAFLVFIENTFGVKLPEEKLSGFKSVLEMSEFIRENKTRNNPETVNWAEILKEKVHITLPQTWFTHNLFNQLSKAFLKFYFRLRGEGQANIPEGPCIIAPNHQSFFDGFFVASFLKRKLMRKTYFYAKEKHWRKRWLQFLANRNNIIIMDINKDLKLSIQKMAAILQKGKNVIIFPEGTRSVDGSLGRFKKTFAILSHELNVPVIPVVINGAFEALPKGAKFPRPFKKISVKFLKPVYPVNHTYESLKEHVYNLVDGQMVKV
jgi:long-chain acyl-CoA synthetase